ncbi:hypothetical protein CDO38_31240 [Pseudomonas aeruginosa]|uniref:hypothetical protein n=1 Tax=Pseudomonas aeruginosa TaxID=287 RepID=UPI0006894411|nr:hypothetical protein [Pseudomonas aeruginosa]OVZ15318.1 hypothetical protein CDO38_31240 [Pseudomonas aeruginosa]OVZ69903.1 hypothetical protein CDO43_15930 [Pseudomonas aeruginosa]
MTDHAELRRLARACDVSRCADEGEERRRLHDFYDCVEPELILDLLDEIDRLRSRLEIDERTPHDGIACRDETIKVLDEKCDRLKADNEALCKDAARYRWLRERDLETIRQGGVFAGMTPENIVLNQEDLDAAIDAALEGATQ